MQNEKKHDRAARVQCAAASAGVAFSTALLLVGCSGGQPQVLTADQFASRNGVIGEPPDKPIPASPPPKPPAEGDVGPVTISPAVGNAVSRPYTEPLTPGDPATRSAEKPDPVTSGQKPDVAPADDGISKSLDIFFVVLDVNGRAVFSDKVLQVLERPLAVEARRLDASGFRRKAQELIERQVQEMTNNELEYAVAEKELEQKEKQRVEQLTVEWRMEQITSAGGSLELARRRYAQEGLDFDEAVKQHNRLLMVQFLYQRRVIGLAQAPAAEIRAYYDRNKDKEFSQTGKAKFRVIRIDPKSTKYIDREAALAAADRIVARAKTEDFATLAADPQINDDGPTNRARGGYTREDGWVVPGSYRFEAVEKAASLLKPGEVSGVIDDRDSGQLFVAKLEEIQEAKVQPFEDPKVQDRIAMILKQAQIQQLREKLVNALRAQAVTSRRPGAMQQLLAIVMQRYPEWAKAGRS